MHTTWCVSHLNTRYRPLQLISKQKQNRPLLTDLQAILCADALALSKSSLHFLSLAHSRATTFYFPNECGPGTYHRGSSMRYRCVPDNTTLMLMERPQSEVTYCTGQLMGWGWKVMMELCRICLCEIYCYTSCIVHKSNCKEENAVYANIRTVDPWTIR